MKVLLKPADYYTQRNNPTVHGRSNYELYARDQCMNTSYVMFLIAAGIKYNNTSDLPDDAYFGKLLISDDAWEFAAKKYPWAKDTDPPTPPNEIHGMYGSYLSPIICGKRASDFRTDLSYDEMLSEIHSGRPVMSSGAFHGIPGHAFVFVGEQDGMLLAADPWGDPWSGYRSTHGYLVPWPRGSWAQHIKPLGDPDAGWGHTVIQEV